MPAFSAASLRRLATCHPDIQRVMKEVIRVFDITVLEGHRGEEAQNEAFRTGRSTLRFPQSRHNHRPALAIDVAPYPIDWKDWRRFDLMAGYILGTASHMGIRLRWGGDWDSDHDMADQTFHDLPHFELAPVDPS